MDICSFRFVCLSWSAAQSTIGELIAWHGGTDQTKWRQAAALVRDMSLADAANRTKHWRERR